MLAHYVYSHYLDSSISATAASPNSCHVGLIMDTLVKDGAGFRAIHQPLRATRGRLGIPTVCDVLLHWSEAQDDLMTAWCHSILSCSAIYH